ncbi:MAG: NAD+ synthase [bacterium]
MKKDKSVRTIRFALAQLNTSVGDLKGNTDKILKLMAQAKKSGADMVLFPELAVTGYPPEDLLLKKKFVKDNITEIKKIAAKTVGITAVAGYINEQNGKIYNSAVVMSAGKIKITYDKINLPNYGVFDEKRYFTKGAEYKVFRAFETNFCISICEDLWVEDKNLMKLRGKIDYLINISASPYHRGKGKERYKLFSKKAKQLNAGIIYLNLVGGQDELVFDGHSMVLGKDGTLLAEGGQFEEALVLLDIPQGIVKKQKNMPELKSKAIKQNKKIMPQEMTALTPEEEIYKALVIGTRDYVRKNGFSKVVIGLSGGIDSALVAVVAAEALGKENVKLIFMPTNFSSQESYIDAKTLCDNMGIVLIDIGIQDIFELYLKILGPFFAGKEGGTAEENLQARIRGNIIMAFSNKFGWMALTTGNKSEMSTGYATLYGDMAGGFAVIKDVPKTVVYDIVKGINKRAGKNLIPENIINKAPTAELRENQKDTDSLPEYEYLDRIIEDYIEKDRSYGDLTEKYDKEILRKVTKMIDINEYKRRQAPPGVKITPKSFGRDRRMPITNKYND